MSNAVIRMLVGHASRRPHDIVLSDEQGTLSYCQLFDRIAHVRAIFDRNGVQPGDRIALCADNSLCCLVAMLAALHAGCAVVPLALRDPPARLARLLAKSRPALLLADSRLAPAWPRLTLDLDATVALGSPGALADASLAPPPVEQAGDALAYIIFTSGSTGEPKGVCIPLASFSHAVSQAAARMGFDEYTRSLLILPLHFDASFSSVFPVLGAGGSVHVHRGPLCMPAEFFAQFDRCHITHTTVTPTYLRTLLAAEAWQDFHGASWRTIAIGGETPPRDVLLRLLDRFPAVQVFNRYGPTEATMAVCTHRLTRALLASDAAIPIGRPHDSVDFAVLGPDGAPVAPGMPGVLYIGGAQLMSGYLDDPAGTAQVLAPRAGSTAPWLATGDIVTCGQDGAYVYVDRADSVIKRNGHRIALAEIEQAFDAVDGIGSAVCVAVRAQDQLFIVAFTVSAPGTAPGTAVDPVATRRALLRVLPAPMLPDLVHGLDRFPVSSGGKADRRALQNLALQLVLPAVHDESPA